MKVIFDENLSPALARGLSTLFVGEQEIVHIRDKFGPSVKDADWISLLSAEGRWVVISGDAKIRGGSPWNCGFRSTKRTLTLGPSPER